MKSFKPMLASDADLKNLRFPLWASPKLDGIRAALVGGKLLTRTLKAVPNPAVRAALEHPELAHLDGELIVGPPTSKTVYRDTVSGVMSHDGEPEFTFYVFDHWEGHDRPWLERYGRLARIEHPRVTVLHHCEILNLDRLLEYEQQKIDEGYEGLILRDPNACYKFGRSTNKEGYLLKLKRFEDSEAEVIGVEEEMLNGNEAQTNELGRMKRSTAKAGLVGKRRMGALIVRDLKTKVEFNIGTGFDAADREWWWQWFIKQDENTPKPIVKYKFFPVGMKDRPRHPVYLGLRDRRDL